jgi:ABC-2 type transport system permease protein
MKGFAAFARKEIQEILHTWRIWVLPGILFFFAMTGPFLTKYTPTILTTFAGNQLNGLTIPNPTYLDSYGQWIKNLSQIVLFALIIIYGGIISSETKSGTAILVLTKPISRSTFLMVKVGIHSIFLTLLVAVGTSITWGLTFATFGTAPASALWYSVLVWLVFGILYIAIMTLLSVLIGSSAGAAGAGLGLYALVSIAAVWRPFANYSPAGITAKSTALAADQVVAWQWPVVTSILLAIVVTFLAAAKFRSKEL